jgi:hypothetical protein
MKISTFFILENFLELAVAGAIIVAAGVFQSSLDPAISIGLAVMLLATVLFARTYRKAARAKNRDQSA